jgi:SAM-dependent methyltransferase
MAKICDYEGSSYRTDFWEGQGREYEDLAERIALRKLLPPAGARLLDIGAGFGRLADLYDGYQQVVLLDYSKSMLRQAQDRLGRGGRYIYVAANLYAMPFVDSLFDTTVTVRVLHHVQDIPAALQEVQRVLRPGGVYVLEYASKRHLKAILRYLLGRQSWSPFDVEPYEFVELNYDFHPAWMEARLREAGFALGRKLAVSSFRLPFLKRLIPPRPLASLDGLLQGPTASLKLAPSIFVQAKAGKEDAQAEARGFFRCPSCHGTDLIEAEDILTCPDCGRGWAIDDGIYDFKELALRSLA